MPDTNNTPFLVGDNQALASYTASYQINGGSSIAAGATITDSITFTGLALTDALYPSSYAIAPRNTITLPKGLQFVGSVITATNTLAVTWKNTTTVAILPPASATWTCAIYTMFFR